MIIGKFGLVALASASLFLAACARVDAASSEAAPTSPGPAVAGAEHSALENRVWKREGADDRPGEIRIFLSDGTLMMDSCWETYRLSSWRMDGSDALAWDEDGMEIHADIVTLDEDRLVLSLKLKDGGSSEEQYVPAPVPYVCPDMPR